MQGWHGGTIRGSTTMMVGPAVGGLSAMPRLATAMICLACSLLTKSSSKIRLQERVWQPSLNPL